MNARDYTYKSTVRESQVDVLGHMNHVQYLQALEEARWQIITDGGFGFWVIAERKIGPAVTEIQIRFLRELRLRDDILIRSVIMPRGLTRYDFHQEIRNGAGDLCCSATVTMVLMDLHIRKPIKPTPEWAQCIGFDTPEAR